jgi:ANTAR domain-containing protein
MMLGLRTEPDGQGGWLDPALAHRAEIHQAAGMVSVQLDLSTAQALARMRAHAFVHNRLLIQVAHDVVARRLARRASTGTPACAAPCCAQTPDNEPD